MAFADAPGGFEQPAFGLDLDVGAAEFPGVAALDGAAEAGPPWSSGHSRCRAQARPESKIDCGARGEPASCTDSGPPERITAFASSHANAASAFWNGTISE